MKTIKTILAVVALFVSLGVHAQSYKENQKKAREIQSSGKYLCGLGTGKNLKQARNEAIAAMSSQISTSVSSDFSYLMNQKTKNDESEYEEKVNNIIHTYTSAILNNTRELVLGEEPKATVLRYMLESDIEKVFEGRKEKALDYALNAASYERSNKIGDALTSYYAALSMLRSIPNSDVSRMTTLTKSVDDILSSINISVEGIIEDDDEKTITLKIYYKGNPVENFNYTYFNGNTRSDICTAKDGTGEVTVPKNLDVKKLDLHAEYICEDEANTDRELRSLIDNTEPVPFRTAKIAVASAKTIKTVQASSIKTPTASVAKNEVSPDAYNSMSYLNLEKASPYLATMQKIEMAIRSNRYESVKNLFTEEGYNMFDKLLHYGNAKLLRSPEMTFLELNGDVTCRSFPMSFTFKGNKKFVEDVVFRINPEGKVFDVAFGLSQTATDDIMQRGAWTEEARQIIVNFLEAYKSAYSLKRLDYLESIFSNDALIITGTIVKSSGNKEISPTNIKHVKYTRQTKEQYMKKLASCFRSNEFVNIHFGDNIIRRSNSNKNIYGIQIKQDYYSSNYGDTGYLFLMVDLKEPKSPLIHVRTWQPDKDPDIKDGRIGMSDFSF